MWIGHRKEVRNWRFERWPFVETSAFETIHIINPVGKTKLSCYTPHRRSTTVSLETYPSILFLDLWVLGFLQVFVRFVLQLF